MNLSRDALFTMQIVLLKEQRLDLDHVAERKYLRIDYTTGFLEVRNLQNPNSVFLSINTLKIKKKFKTIIFKLQLI